MNLKLKLAGVALAALSLAGCDKQPDSSGSSDIQDNVSSSSYTDSGIKPPIVDAPVRRDDVVDKLDGGELAYEYVSSGSYSARLNLSGTVDSYKVRPDIDGVPVTSLTLAGEGRIEKLEISPDSMGDMWKVLTEWDYADFGKHVGTVIYDGTEWTLPQFVAAFNNGVDPREMDHNGMYITDGGKTLALYSPLFDRSGGGAVAIPEGIEEIGDDAFCADWENRLAVTSVSFPSTLKKIGERSFNHCDGLTSLTLGENVEEIGNSAFSLCVGLTEVNLNDRLSTIGRQAFSGLSNLKGELAIPDSVKSVGESAFEYCGFESVSIGSGLETLGGKMFESCENLKSVTVPSTVKSLGFGVFVRCSGLESVTFEEGCESIAENSVWLYCSNLSEIRLPSTLKEFNMNSISGTNVKSLAIPDGASVTADLDDYTWRFDAEVSYRGKAYGPDSYKELVESGNP